MLIVRLKAALPDEYRERASIEHDVSPALAMLLQVWQELREHPERAVGGAEPMLQLDQHEPWMDAEIEAPVGEPGDEVAPDWQAEQQAFDARSPGG